MLTNMLGTIIIPAAVIVLIVLFMAMSRSIEYQCEHCGSIFNLPPVTAVTAPHMMGKKLVKCPRCGMTAWVSPIRRDR